VERSALLPSPADVAVVIVSANSAGWLPACISSLVTHAGDIRTDVVVVDSGSTDDTIDVARAAGARVVRCENRGFAHANNRGIETTDAEWVLLLNPDTEFDSGTVAELVAVGRARPSVGVLGVRQTFADGTLQRTIRRFPTPLRTLGQALAVEAWPVRPAAFGERVLDPDVYERYGECDWTSGSFMLVRRAALDRAGLLDERFFLYREEPDLCLRIKDAGWVTAHSPAVTIVHHGGNESSDPRLAAQQAHSRRLYGEKHFSRAGQVMAVGALAVGYGIRAVLGSRGPRANARSGLVTVLGLEPPPFASLSGAAAPQVRRPR
jgi:N-acetylglucosaminyl-diphospho-decaprenol L-rhamnosyltransferase